MTEKTEDKPDNMALWNAVCETDPATTTEVKQRGGFTAICAQSQLKRATERWGPYGDIWGVRGLCWGSMGGPNADNPAEITLDAEFYYPGGAFEISSDMAYKPGNDTRKKLLTDLTTKALSKLGFNSDVFEGKGALGFGDNKYAAKQKAKAKEKAKPAPEPPPPAKPTAPLLRIVLDKVEKTPQFHMGEFLKHYTIPQPAALTPGQRTWLFENMEKGTPECIRIMDEAKVKKNAAILASQPEVMSPNEIPNQGMPE